MLNKEEIEKHRKVAKTDFIWKAWPLEMMYKTIIKKATRIHFEDVFKEMNEEDNKSIDPGTLSLYRILLETQNNTISENLINEFVYKLVKDNGEELSRSEKRKISKLDKKYHLDQNIIENIEEAQDYATQWLWTYNNDRPNMGIGGITPAQKLKIAA